MSRILAIDIGLKRCGLAVTDTLRISVNPIGAVPRMELKQFVLNYCRQEEVAEIVLGLSRKLSREDNTIMKSVYQFEKEIKRSLPNISVKYQDEFNSSKEAAQILIQIGAPKKKRQKKENLDIISACIILQRYLGNI